jgi:hypothetical protein
MPTSSEEARKSLVCFRITAADVELFTYGQHDVSHVCMNRSRSVATVAHDSAKHPTTIFYRRARQYGRRKDTIDSSGSQTRSQRRVTWRVLLHVNARLCPSGRAPYPRIHMHRRRGNRDSSSCNAAFCSSPVPRRDCLDV